jgi:SAM-dependent methyltransferase
MSFSSSFTATDGEAYELQMGRWSRRLAPLFSDFAGVDGAASVLDVGCGTGNLGRCLVQDHRVASTHGLDMSSAYIEHARHCNADPRLAFQVGDACALPFTDKSFDHTVSMLALQFVPHADIALREMRRVTRPGGTVAAATWDTRGGFVVLRMILDAAAMLDESGRRARAAAYTRPLSRPGELSRLWHDGGLIDVVQEMRTIRMDFASFEDFWTPMEGNEGPVAAYVGSLGTNAKAQLRHAVAGAYLDGEPDGPRSYAATAWVAKGAVVG